MSARLLGLLVLGSFPSAVIGKRGGHHVSLETSHENPSDASDGDITQQVQSVNSNYKQSKTPYEELTSDTKEAMMACYQSVEGSALSWSWKQPNAAACKCLKGMHLTGDDGKEKDSCSGRKFIASELSGKGCKCSEHTSKKQVDVEKLTSASAETVWAKVLEDMHWEKWDKDMEKITDVQGGLVQGGTFTHVGKDGMSVYWTIDEFVKNQKIKMSGRAMGGLVKSEWVIATTPQDSGGCIISNAVDIYGGLGSMIGYFASSKMQKGAVDCLENMATIAEDTAGP